MIILLLWQYIEGVNKMKKKYKRPFFYAEEYVVNDSVAKCSGDDEISIEDTETLTLNVGERACAKDSGHKAGNGTIPRSSYPITLFNDGTETEDDKCKYDWNGGQVTDAYGTEYGTWGIAIFGATAGNDNHRPGYLNKAFFS